METLRFDWTGKYAVKKGGSYEARFTFTNSNGSSFNFTGCTGFSAVAKPGGRDIIATLPVTFTTPLASGIVKVNIPWSTLISDYIEPGRYDWDLLVLLSNGDRWYAVEGDFMIKRSTSNAS